MDLAETGVYPCPILDSQVTGASAPAARHGKPQTRLSGVSNRPQVQKSGIAYSKGHRQQGEA